MAKAVKTPPKRTPSALRQYLIEQGHTELLDETDDEAIHKQRVSTTPPQEERSAQFEARFFRSFRLLSSPVEVIRADLRKIIAEWRWNRDHLLQELELRDHGRMQEWVRPTPKDPIGANGERRMVDLKGRPMPIRFQRRNFLRNILGIFDPFQPFPVDLTLIHTVKTGLAVLRESSTLFQRRRGR